MRATLVLLSTLLAAPAHPAEREDVRLPTRTDDRPYSDAVRVGDIVFLAGKIGFEPGTRNVPEEPEAEIRNALDGVKATLSHLGLTMDDLVSVQVFCSDVSLYERFNGVYRTYFEKRLPVRAFVGSGPLLGGARFEIQGIAHMRPPSE